MKYLLPRILSCVVLWLVASTSLLSQTGAGAITGTVRDPNGAVIPGALVHAIKLETNATFDTVSNDEGVYTIPSLFVGQYRLQVSCSGMATWQGDVSLQVGQRAVIDVKMTIQSANEQVTVAGDQSQLITTDSGAQSKILERERIEQIPMNGRSITGVIQSTVPGYESSGGPLPRVNGLQWGAFGWVQDGTPIDNRDLGGVEQLPPDPDSIQEVRVETSNSSAKFDRPGTAILSTKSGTNAIHGSAFETNRNNSYGVAKNRQDVTTVRAPKLIRNEFGASVGGPIFLPYLWPGPKLYNGKNRSFFFVAYEQLALRQNVSQNLYVQTDAMRNGDFSGLTNGTGQKYTLYDSTTTASSNPWTRQVFPNNQIPLSRMSPLAKSLLAISPHATNGNNPYAASNWQGTTPNNWDTKSLTMRFDQRFSEKDSGFLRYTWGNTQSHYIGYTQYGPPTLNNEANITYAPVKVQGIALSETHIFSPTFYNEFVASMNYEADLVQTGPNPNQDYASKLGLENNYGLKGFPQIAGSSVTGNAPTSLLQNYGQGDNTRRDNDYINQFDDNLTLIRGRHTLQFGSRYRHERLNILPDQPRPSQVMFNGMGTAIYNASSGTQYSAQGNTGLATADFFLGYAAQYANVLPSHYLRLRDQEIGSYFQDDFRIRHNLTLNLGLRWEVHPALHEKYNQFTGFDLKNHAMVTGSSIERLYQLGFTTPAIVNGLEALGVKFETTEQAGFPKGVIKSQYFTFGPRLGAAYKPFGANSGTVLRGGYGTYIFPPPTRNFYGTLNGQTPYTNSFSLDYTNANQFDGLTNYILRSPQTVVSGLNSSGVIPFNSTSSFTPGFFGLNVLDPNYPVSYVHEWNVTVEQELKGHSALSIAYVANHGANLEQYWNMNTKPSNYVWFVTTGKDLPSGRYANTATRPYDTTTYGEIQVQRKTGYSNMNSLQVNYQRLFHKGLAYQVSYVFSRNFRIGGNGFRDSLVYPTSTFLPGLAPSSADDLNRYQNYGLDNGTPIQRLRYNWVLDMPVGRGKRFLSGANHALDLLVGGWQLAGTGTMFRNLWRPSTSDWGPMTPVHYYGTKYKVLDCRGGATCYKAYLGYNGYIAPNLINKPKGIQGVPASYVPSHEPLVPVPADGGSPSDPNYQYYNTQTVKVTLANGKVVPVAYSPGPQGVHPFSHLYRQGPFEWGTDASLFKTFPVGERFNLKFNADFFNVFNQQGTQYPDSNTGIINTTSSYMGARVIQLTARLSW